MDPKLKTALVVLAGGFFTAVAAVFAQLGPADLNVATLIFAAKAGVIGGIVAVAALFTDKPRNPDTRERIDDVGTFRNRNRR